MFASRVSHNIVANTAGRAWMMAMSFAFVPVYINLLGIESYALIGFFATLMVLFSLLDFGLSASLNRELARRSVLPDEQDGMRDVVRTLEVVYWTIGCGIGIAIFLLAPIIAHRWLQPVAMRRETVESCIRLMGIAIAFQWPTGLYGGGLVGLQQQVRSNLIDIFVATLRGIGAIGILLFVSRSLEAYFIWQALVSAIGVLSMRVLLWRLLPKIARVARIDRAIFQSIWRFAVGMTGISIISVILMQADKVLLSTLLPLDAYANYILATGLAAACGFMVAPISNAVYPRLTQLVSSRDGKGLSRVYHDGCALIAVAIIPISGTVALFSYEIIHFWTGNSTLAGTAAPIATLLTIGTCLNSLMMIPYMLQLANGSTRLTLWLNSISVVLLIPMIFILAKHFGATGAALGWPILNGGQLFLFVPVVHRMFLPGATRRWLLQDIGLPVAVCAPILLLGRLLIPGDLPALPGFGLAGLVGLTTLVATLLALPQTRNRLIDAFSRRTFEIRRTVS